MKCKACDFWDADQAGASKYIVGLCRKCTLEILEVSADAGDPIIVRKDYRPPSHRRERVVRGVKLFWYKERWRAG